MQSWYLNGKKIFFVLSMIKSIFSWNVKPRMKRTQCPWQCKTKTSKWKVYCDIISPNEHLNFFADEKLWAPFLKIFFHFCESEKSELKLLQNTQQLQIPKLATNSDSDHLSITATILRSHFDLLLHKTLQPPVNNGHFCIVCHGFRLMKRDDYFFIHFDHV
jgi:hypothetical protein